MTSLVSLDTNTVLARYQTETIEQIAQSLGASDVGLYLKIIREAPEQWKEHQAAKALRDLERAEERLEGANGMLEIARAREVLKSAQWRLERVLRRIYGQDQPSSVGQAVQININLRGAPQRSSAAIEHEGEIAVSENVESRG